MKFQFGDYVFDGIKLYRQGQEVELTGTEDALLRLLVQKAASGNPLTTQEIYEKLKELRGKGKGPSTSVIHTHIGNLRRTLGLMPDGRPYLQNNSYRLACAVQILGTKHIVKMSPPVTHGADPHNPPYVGPQPFSAAHADYFYGRTQERADLVKLLADTHDKRVVLLYAASGAGKTSLIEAALGPDLSRAGCHVLPTARVGVPPDADINHGNPYTLAALASIGENSAMATWADYLATQSNHAPRIVLVLDQLEEIITTSYGENDWQQKRAFFVQLRAALAQHPDLSLLLAFREEYLAEMQRLAVELSALWQPYTLELLSRAQAHEAIIGPAQRQSVEFPEDILHLLVNALSCRRYVDHWHRVHTEHGEYVEPLHLQITCRALWEKLLLGQRRISWENFQTAPAENAAPSPVSDTQTVNDFVAGVLQDFCSQALGKAADATQSLSGQRLDEALIVLGCARFITPEGTRNPVRQDAEWTGDLPNAAVTALAQCHLLRLEQRHDGARWYELSHDTLVQPILEQADSVTDEKLRDLFAATVQELAASAQAREQEHLTAELLSEECCLALLAEDGAPKTMTTGNGHLPGWVVEDLAARYLLRPEQNGYVLLSPRLAQALYQGQFRALDRLHQLRQALATLTADYAMAQPGFWTQQADKIKGVLAGVKGDMGVARLSEPEAEFVFAASLATGYEVAHFTQELEKKFVPVLARMLPAALDSGNAARRRNAVVAARYFAPEGQDKRLIQLALSDADESVRQAAAVTLAGRDSQTWELIFQSLGDAAQRAAARDVLGWMYDAVVPERAGEFAARVRRLSGPARWQLWAKLAGVRLQSHLVSILVILVFTMMIALLVMTLPRIAVGVFKTNFLQLPGIFRSFFHVLVGSISWSLFMGGSLLVWWAMREGGPPRWPGRGHVSTACATAWGGLAGGIAKTCMVILVYDLGALATLHWIPTPDSSVMESLTQTGLAFALPFYGMIGGLGMGITASRIRPLSEPSRKRDAARAIFLQVLRNTAPMVLTIAFAIIASYVFLQQMPYSKIEFRQLVGEGFSMWALETGILTGIFFGLFLLKRGLHIQSSET